LERELYQRAWSDEFITYVHIVLSEGADLHGVVDGIQRSAGERYGLRLYTRATILDYFAGQVRQAFALAYLMEGMTFLLLVVAIGDTLAAWVTERTRRFGIMRALGFTRRDVFELVMLEGATIGTLGLGMAAAVGAALGFFWVTIQFPALLGWRIDVHVPYAFAAAAAIVTLLLCLTGSLLPSRRAAKLVVAEALRSE
jgi:putative ABC transport system permease protein